MHLHQCNRSIYPSTMFLEPISKLFASESSLQPVPKLPDELNALLVTLTEVFPEHQVSILRDILLDSSQESRLHIAADALLQDTNKFSKRANLLGAGKLERWEMFRSLEYTRATENLL
jgi:hypothetical protein